MGSNKTTPNFINDWDDKLKLNEHLLNFFSDSVVIPDWLPSKDLKLILGAGDSGNIEMLSEYDVFYNNGSMNKLKEDLEYLIENYNKQKVICVIDNNNPKHIKLFSELFKERFKFITTNGGHCPHFNLYSYHYLLQLGGEARNIFESSDGILNIDELITYLEKQRDFGGYLKHNTYNVVTDRLYPQLHLIPEEKIATAKALLKEGIMKASLSGTAALNMVPDFDSYNIGQLIRLFHSSIISQKLPITLWGHIEDEGIIVVTKFTNFEILYSNVEKLPDETKDKKLIQRRLEMLNTCYKDIDKFINGHTVCLLNIESFRSNHKHILFPPQNAGRFRSKKLKTKKNRKTNLLTRRRR